MITNPVAVRKIPHATPAKFGLSFEEIVITNREGLRLIAWYLPTTNGAVVLLQHGYKSCREEMLPAATVLHRRGYGVLVTSVRAHDLCGGEQITFGFREIDDLENWLEYLRGRVDWDHRGLAVLGNSMGGSMVIQLAARNPEIKAVVTDGAFSSVKDTVATTVAHYTGLPAFPFAPMILWWAEAKSGCALSRIDAKESITQLKSRPVLLMQGGADSTVSRLSGERLFTAAHEPKELWYDPLAGHARFSTNMPAYAERLLAFFDKHLLGDRPPN